MRSISCVAVAALAVLIACTRNGGAQTDKLAQPGDEAGKQQRREQLQKEIDELQKRIDKLKKELDELPLPPPPVVVPTRGFQTMRGTITALQPAQGDPQSVTVERLEDVGPTVGKRPKSGFIQFGKDTQFVFSDKTPAQRKDLRAGLFVRAEFPADQRVFEANVVVIELAAREILCIVRRAVDENDLKKVAAQVDFKKEYLLHRSWMGSGQDRILFSVEEGKDKDSPRVVFTFVGGKTKDNPMHTCLFAIARNAKIEGGQGNRIDSAEDLWRVFGKVQGK